MIITMAWRNIWRSPMRSLVVIIAIGLGVWALLFLLSLTRGMIGSYIRSAINERVSHIQIHEPNFKEDRDIKFVIPGSTELMDELNGIPQIVHAAKRTLSNGMMSTAKGARGIQIYGINPEKEAALTGLDSRISEGQYIDAESRNPILVSEKLAQRLNVKLRSKVVLTFQNTERDITSAAFRIVGLIKTTNASIEESMVYVRNQDLQRLLDFDDGQVHEIAMVLNDIEDLDVVHQQLAENHPELLVETYKEISPDLELFNSQLDTQMMILTFIVMLALIFGIINTMLMAVLERIRELGMLMAIGMNRIRLFFMIMLETILLGMVGAPFGILISYLTIKAANRNGIDLSVFSEGFEQFGMASLIYPEIEPHLYTQVAIAVGITAILASIYPAIKAIRLKPVEALRKI